MTKTFSLPRALLIRVEIFGLLFALALLVGLCSGCGDGTEPDSLPDSGMVAKTDSGTIAKTDSGSKVDSQPSSDGIEQGEVSDSGSAAKTDSQQPVTCKLPADVENLWGQPPAGFPYLVTSDSVTCANSPSLSQPPYNKLTCSQLVADGPAEYTILPGTFCCAKVHRSGSSGPVSVSGVTCDGVGSATIAVLCSTSEVFLGFACLTESP